FGKHLEEKHVTWTQFGKKLDRNITLQARDFHSDAFTKSALKVKLLIKIMTSQSVETASGFAMTPLRVKERRETGKHHNDFDAIYSRPTK
ncbi:hypothetical protein Tco_0759340, partial [Tanacetum coccineum]